MKLIILSQTFHTPDFIASSKNPLQFSILEAIKNLGCGKAGYEMMANNTRFAIKKLIRA